MMLATKTLSRISGTWAAIEVSTSKIRLQIHDELGKPIWSEFIRQVRIRRPRGVFQKPSRWLRGIESLFAKAHRDGIDMTSLRAIAVCSTTPTLIAVDANGKSLDDEARLWSDTRRCGELNSSGNNSGLLKLAYLAATKDERTRFNQTAFYADAGPYLVAQLTGRLVSGAAMLAQKFGMKSGEFDRTGLDILDHTQMDLIIDRIPQIVTATGDVVGTLNRSNSTVLGIPEGVPVTLCGYDSVCGVAGACVCGPSKTAVFSVGTSATIYKCPQGNSTNLGPWTPIPNMLPGQNLLMSGGFEAGGQSIELLHKELRLTCGAARDAELEVLASRAEHEYSDHCISLPFGGVPLRAPLPGVVLDTVICCDNPAPGLVESLTAMRRGIACFLNYCVMDLALRGEEINDLRVVGGGTRSPSFCQLIADVTRIPVRRFDGTAAASGAAIMTIATIDGHSAADAARTMLENRSLLHSPTDVVVRQELYRNLYARFRNRLKKELAFTRED